MGKALIIGCGGVASVAIHKCCQNSEVFEEICIASRTAQVDADNVEELVALIRKVQPDVVLNLALPYQDLHIMDACLETGVHYVDTANYEPEDTAKFEYKWQWAYKERYEKAGITALLGSGFDPGVTSVFSAYALKHYFDEINYIDILDCNAGEGKEIIPLQFLKAVLPDPSSLGPRTKGKTNIGCIFTGKKDGVEKTIYIYNTCDHQECYKEVGSQAVAYTTGVPAMIGTMMLMTGTWQGPGVFNIEEFDPDPFMDALNKWGLSWKIKENPDLVD